jgi:hypothetical protein
MNTLRYLTIICVLTMSAAGVLRAQWAPTNGPYGGTVLSLASSGAMVFAGTNGGVFVSNDTGATWTSSFAGMTNGTADALAINPIDGVVYAGTIGGMFRSTNNGVSWQAVPALATQDIRSIAFTGGGATIWVGGSGGVLRSTDGGSGWVRVDTGFANNYVRTVVPIEGLSGTVIYVGTPGALYVSTNNGAGWSQVGSTLSGNVYAVTQVDTMLFVGTSGGLYALLPDHVTWQRRLTNYTSTLLLNRNASGGLDILVGSIGGGVFTSSDTGRSWNLFNGGLSDLGVHTLSIDPVGGGSAYLFAGTFNGVFRTPIENAAWASFSSGLSSTSVLSLAVQGPDLFAGTPTGVFRSVDRGVTWTAVDTGLTSTYVQALASSGTYLYAGTNTGVFVSTNGGSTWTAPGTGLSGFIYALGTFGGTIFAGTGAGVYASTDAGSSWNPANTGLQTYIVNAVANIGPLIFAGTSSNGVFMSNNSGVSWAPVDSGLTNKFVHALAVVGTDLFAGTIGGGAFRSTDGGATWTPVDSGLTSHNVFAFAVSGTNLFAGTDSGGIFVSADHGDHWINVTTGIPLASPSNVADVLHMNINALVVSGTDLFAATSGLGVWNRPISEMATSVGPEVARDVPTEFGLGQNYPNPFNPSTTFTYQLPVDSRVRVVVYNIFGQVVATLVDANELPGFKNVQWRAADMASGVYFCRIDASGLSAPAKTFTEVRKMLLLK